MVLVVSACSATNGGEPASPETQSRPTTSIPASKSTTTTVSADGLAWTFELISDDPAVGPAEGDRYTNPGGIIVVDGTYHMLRNSFSVFLGDSRVHHMTSPDGLTWEEGSLVLDSDLVPYADRNVRVADVLVENGSWVAYFYTFDGPSQPGFIGRATASTPDGPWTVDPEPVLSPGPEGSWDSRRLAEPSVIAAGDGYLMYYAGFDDTDTAAIGLAVSSDGMEWVKHDDPGTTEAAFQASDPVIAGRDDWARRGVAGPNVETYPAGLVMVFNEHSRRPSYWMATSENGYEWQISTSPVITRENSPRGLQMWQSELVRTDDRQRLYLEAGPATGTNIYIYDLTMAGGG